MTPEEFVRVVAAACPPRERLLEYGLMTRMLRVFTRISLVGQG
jgi:hypothetical protein